MLAHVTLSLRGVEGAALLGFVQVFVGKTRNGAQAEATDRDCPGQTTELFHCGTTAQWDVTIPSIIPSQLSAENKV